MIFLSDLICRFDTYRSKDESRRLAQYVEAVEDGQILAMMVNDEGSNNLEDSAKKTLAKLGSHHFHRLGFRYKCESHWVSEKQLVRNFPWKCFISDHVLSWQSFIVRHLWDVHISARVNIFKASFEDMEKENIKYHTRHNMYTLRKSVPHRFIKKLLLQLMVLNPT